MYRREVSVRTTRIADAISVAPVLPDGPVARATELSSIARAVRAALPAADIAQGGNTLLVTGATEAQVRAALSAPRPPAAGPRHHEIEIVYDGPDLEAVAESAGITPGEVASLHAGRTYTALVTGFLPGFAYLGEVDDELVMPRLASPRKRVAAGAVGIAGKLTGVYPFSSPGGWRWIGSARGARLFDPDRDPPRRIAVLDTVRFVGAEAATGSRAGAAPADVSGARDRGPVLVVGRVPPVATVQDLGRPGRRAHGIPASGALDADTLAAANRAVGNPSGAAAIEVLLGSFTAVAARDVTVSIDGSTAALVRSGQTLTVPSSERAVRYLAIQGGVDVPLVLGSRSTLTVAALGGFGGRALARGDEIPNGSASEASAHADGPQPLDDAPLELVPTEPDPRLGPGALDVLLGSGFQVSTALDRLGTRLAGPPLPRAQDDLALPEPVLPGAVQITGDGSVIILGPDAAVTGGYPVAAYLTPDARHRLARRRPGEPVRFRLQ